jgi:hypothetical protein
LQSDSKALTAQLQKFPLRIILRAYEKAKTIEPQLTIYNFIFRDLKNHVAADDAELDHALKYLLSSGSAVWPAPGSEDTELGVLMEPEVDHGETEVYPRVQA